MLSRPTWLLALALPGLSACAELAGVDGEYRLASGGQRGEGGNTNQGGEIARGGGTTAGGTTAGGAPAGGTQAGGATPNGGGGGGQQAIDHCVPGRYIGDLDSTRAVPAPIRATIDITVDPRNGDGAHVTGVIIEKVPTPAMNGTFQAVLNCETGHFETTFDGSTTTTVVFDESVMGNVSGDLDATLLAFSGQWDATQVRVAQIPFDAAGTWTADLQR